MSPHAYTVVAVRYGELSTTRSDVYLNYADYGASDDPAALAYYFWVVTGEGRTVVLDTGFSAEVGQRRGRALLIDPVEAFDRLEVPDDADTLVVLSHAHYDHIGNLDRFRRAVFVMATAEYEYWVHGPRPLDITHRVVEEREIAQLRDLRAAGRLRLVDGSVDLVPGVRIVPGPGHTPGQLMLAVETERGALLLTSDAVHTDEELARRMPFRHMCALPAAAETYDLIDDLAARSEVRLVVAGHEPALVGRFPADPRLPDHTLVLSEF